MIASWGSEEHRHKVRKARLEERFACDHCDLITNAGALALHRRSLGLTFEPLVLHNPRTYRGIFIAAFGEPPWTCHFCGNNGATDVHHLDDDHYNNVLENLVATHHGCHSSHHMAGKPVWVGPRPKEWNRRGWKHSAETIEKMRGPRKTPRARPQRVQCSLCDRTIAAGQLNKHLAAHERFAARGQPMRRPRRPSS